MNIYSELEKLNPEQRQAATTIDGPVLVLAGAGTGKTKVITTRIAYMLSQGIPAGKMVAVSFTNKAAKEMRERVAHMVGKQFAKAVELSTFHSFALKLLRQYHVEAGLRRNFTIADERESAALLKETLRELTLEELLSVPAAAAKIAHLKDQCLTAETLEQRTSIFDKAILKALFESYNRRLRLYNLVDFDDIVYLLVIMLRKHPAVLEKIQESYSHFMVDEYQDTSCGQFELIRMLGAKYQNVCVVGDDDQSIYSWRGANPESIQEFIAAFPSVKKVTLEQNYRCSPNILNVANSVIAVNTKRLGKTLWSKQSNLHHITVHKAESERDEALFVADKIQALRQEEPGFSDSSVSILVRANSQALPLEQVFQERNIPYVVHGGTKFFDRKEIRDVVSYLRFAHNPCDLNALFRVVNMPPRGIGLVTLEKIKSDFENLKLSQKNVTAKEILEKFAKTHKGVAEFFELWKVAEQKLLNAEGQTQVVDALQFTFDHMGLRKDIFSSAPNMQAANFKIDLVERFFEMTKSTQLESQNLAGLVDALHLDEPQFERTKDASKSVQIMTMHSAKGLEFPFVFIVGAEENIIPHERSIDSLGGVEEERRLFYVAITRAKHRLFISHCGFRSKSANGSKKEPQPSRFLSNVPTNLVASTETDVHTEESRRMAAAKRLFEMFR